MKVEATIGQEDHLLKVQEIASNSHEITDDIDAEEIKNKTTVIQSTMI